MIDQWTAHGYDDTEKVRSLVDLFFVSVLLDAGAGDHWRFREEKTGKVYNRSEGIAVASLYMFLDALFAIKDFTRKDIVHGKLDLRVYSQTLNSQVEPGSALHNITVEELSRGFQIDGRNTLIGVTARAEIMQRLGSSLRNLPDIFGPEGRPGKLVGKRHHLIMPIEYYLTWRRLPALSQKRNY